MDEKKNAWFFVLFFSTIMILFFIADLIKSDRLYSENENRVLASKPDFSIEALRSGKYSKDYEKYVTDQFIGRDNWIMIKTKTDILLQKKAIQGVYLGKDDYLIEQHLPEDISQETVDKRLKKLKELVEYSNAKVMLVPTADNIITEKLPANAVYYDQTQLLEQVKNTVGETQFIDVYSILKEHSEEEIYYRTDHHWTTKGAYYGYQAWAEQQNETAYPYQLEKLKTVSDSFLGTLHSKINISMKPDFIQCFPETFVRQVKVTYDFRTTTNTLYEEKYLSTKNQYAYFLDDNHAFIEIETYQHNGKQLFLIKDSYANCMIPLLAPHYEKIYVLDLRYYNGKLYDLIDSCRTQTKMDIMVLYNCIHFIEDFQYY